MILELAEAPCERDVLGARDVLVAQEQHAMPDQLRADLGEQAVVVHGVGEAHIQQFRADRAGQGFDSHARLLRR